MTARWIAAIQRAVVAAIAIFVISLGAILAGRGYVRTAQRMRSLPS